MWKWSQHSLNPLTWTHSHLWNIWKIPQVLCLKGRCIIWIPEDQWKKKYLLFHGIFFTCSDIVITVLNKIFNTATLKHQIHTSNSWNSHLLLRNCYNLVWRWHLYPCLWFNIQDWRSWKVTGTCSILRCCHILQSITHLQITICCCSSYHLNYWQHCLCQNSQCR